MEHFSIPVQCPPERRVSSALRTSFAVVQRLHTEPSRTRLLLSPPTRL